MRRAELARLKVIDIDSQHISAQWRTRDGKIVICR